MDELSNPGTPRGYISPRGFSSPRGHKRVLVVKQSPKNEAEVVATIEDESVSGDQVADKHAEFISNYKAINEKLSRELDDFKNKKYESRSERVDDPGGNEESKKELAMMQDL